MNENLKSLIDLYEGKSPAQLEALRDILLGFGVPIGVVLAILAIVVPTIAELYRIIVEARPELLRL